MSIKKTKRFKSHNTSDSRVECRADNAKATIGANGKRTANGNGERLEFLCAQGNCISLRAKKFCVLRTNRRAAERRACPVGV